MDDGPPRDSKPNGRGPVRVDTGERWPNVWEAWPILMVVVLFGGWFWGTLDIHVAPSVLKSAELVDRTPPIRPTWNHPPRGVEDVLRDLSRGDCWTASARLRGLRKSAVDADELRVLEGAAFVCAGNGKAAARAVDPLVELDFNGEATWIRANAALLSGDVDEARLLLEQAVERDTDKRRAAEALLDRLDTL
jgi:hypothetical protein